MYISIRTLWFFTIFVFLNVRKTFCYVENVRSNVSQTDYALNKTVMIELSTFDAETKFYARTTDYPIFSEKDNFGNFFKFRLILTMNSVQKYNNYYINNSIFLLQKI